MKSAFLISVLANTAFDYCPTFRFFVEPKNRELRLFYEIVSKYTKIELTNSIENNANRLTNINKNSGSFHSLGRAELSKQLKSRYDCVLQGLVLVYISMN